MSDEKNFLLRINGDLYDALERWAADNLRGVNAQVGFLFTDFVCIAGRIKEKKNEEKRKQNK